MNKLSHDDLYSLEDYARQRPTFRAKVMQHKKNRHVGIGEHASLYFEDRLTMHYQIQEMLRAERIFEAEGIEEELETYNPLIPDGKNWKATFMIEYGDENERRIALANLRGIEDQVWVKVGNFDKVFGIANEDLERSNAEKTSAVHFMRFELQNDMITALKEGAMLGAGIDHPACKIECDNLDKMITDALVADLQ